MGCTGSKTSGGPNGAVREPGPRSDAVTQTRRVSMSTQDVENSSFNTPQAGSTSGSGSGGGGGGGGSLGASTMMGDSSNASVNDADPSLSSEQRILNRIRARAPIHRIVLTGGPCAGKSTILSSLQTKLPQRTGFRVFCVPEAATLLMQGGLTWDNMTEEKVIEYQLALLKTQIALEDNFKRIAVASGQPSLIVCDRGTMDGRAYASDAQFQEILRRGGYSMESLRDERYDAVIHMVTAAIGAEKHYNYDNPVRYETLEEAKASDEKLRKMYIGHPQLRVFDNSTTFEQKIDRVMDFVCDVIGCKHTYHRVKRYLITDIPTEDQIPVEFVRVTVTQTVLNHSTDDKVMMLMKRQQGEATVFFYQCIRHTHRSSAAVSPNGSNKNLGVGSKHEDPNAVSITSSSGSSVTAAGATTTATGDDDVDSLSSTQILKREVVKEEHRITAREYASLLTQRDLRRVDVVKDNFSFVYADHYIELAKFREPQWYVGKAVMYVDCEKDAPSLPPFIKIAEDMGDLTPYSAYHASLPPAAAQSGTH